MDVIWGKTVKSKESKGAGEPKGGTQISVRDHGNVLKLDCDNDCTTL